MYAKTGVKTTAATSRTGALLGYVAEIQNFPTCHQDLSMEKLATREGECIYIPL